MKKLFLFVIFFLINSVYANTSLDSCVNFFLGKKLFHNRDYDGANFFFNNVVDALPDYSDKCLKSKVYIILAPIKSMEFRTALLTVRSVKASYNKSDAFLETKCFKLLHGLALYRIAKENDSLFSFFDKDKYHEDLILEALGEIDSSYIFDILPFALFLKDKIEDDRMTHELRLIRDYIDKQSYFSAIHRIELHIERDNLASVYKYELFFLLLKSYNELHLEQYSKYLFLLFLK